MEALIALPVLLLVSLAVGQFAHIWFCRQILHYAAYSGARAALVARRGDTGETRAREAAKRICALISLEHERYMDDDTVGVRLPGVGLIFGSGTVEEKLQVRVTTVNGRYIRCDVTMDVPLIFPLAGDIIGGTMKLYSGDGSNAPGFNPGKLSASEKAQHGVGTTFIHDGYFFPHIRLRERAYIFKPFNSSWGVD